MRVIGVGGQAQNGKDTLADYLAERLNEAAESHNAKHWKRTAFASNVKKVFMDSFNVDKEFIEEWKTKDQAPEGFLLPVRKCLQKIGDGFRTMVPTIWMDLVFRNKDSDLIISDLRYVNEFNRVYDEGGLTILIARKERINYDSNPSEAELRPYIEWCMEVFENRSVVILDAEDIRDLVESHGLPFKEVDGEQVQLTFDEFYTTINKMNVFVNNSDTIDDLYNAVDSVLLDYIASRDFKG